MQERMPYYFYRMVKNRSFINFIDSKKPKKFNYLKKVAAKVALRESDQDFTC